MASFDLCLTAELLLVLLLMLTLEPQPASAAAQSPSSESPDPYTTPSQVSGVLPPIPLPSPQGNRSPERLPAPSWTAETDLHAQRILRLERRRPDVPGGMPQAAERRGSGVHGTRREPSH